MHLLRNASNDEELLILTGMLYIYIPYHYAGLRKTAFEYVTFGLCKSLSDQTSNKLLACNNNYFYGQLIVS